MANLKGSKTEQCLKDAFAGESQANRRYLYIANRFEKFQVTVSVAGFAFGRRAEDRCNVVESFDVGLGFEIRCGRLFGGCFLSHVQRNGGVRKAGGLRAAASLHAPSGVVNCSAAAVVDRLAGRSGGVDLPAPTGLDSAEVRLCLIRIP